jgi:hypothetical protein
VPLFHRDLGPKGPGRCRPQRRPLADSKLAARSADLYRRIATPSLRHAPCRLSAHLRTWHSARRLDLAIRWQPIEGIRLARPVADEILTSVLLDRSHRSMPSFPNA